MSILRVLVRAAPDAAQAVPWALFDGQERVVRRGTSPPSGFPAADRREAVLAASAVRLVRIALPPMPADRIAAAAAFALEDRLAGPAQGQHLVAAPRQRDGAVDVAVAARDLFAPLARDFARVVAEPAIAPVPPASTWRWHASAADGGFVRRADGSAFAVPIPADGAPLPPELALALSHAARTPGKPARLDVAFPVNDAALATWSQESGVAFARVPPWQWDQDGPALAAGMDLLQGDFARTPIAAPGRGARTLRLAACIAAGALALHVLASVAQWGALRYESWQTQRAIVAAARDAGITEADGADASAVALRDRFVQARHRAGHSAPSDALPLLARAAPALAQLPPGALKSATFVAGSWTLDLARLDAAVAARLDRELVAAGLAVLAAPSASGLRMRLSPAAGTELP